MTLTQPCKICGREMNLEADDQCEQRWINAFLAMLCCNQCFDLREERLTVTHRIVALCQYVRALDGLNIKQEDKKRKRSQARERLIVRTKEYARWFRKAVGGRVEVWSEDFADLLTDKPGDCDEILRQYRNGARAEVLGRKEGELNPSSL